MTEPRPTLLLRFGDLTAEALADDGGVAALEQVAEESFDLHPQSYGFYDPHGKVETNAALRRSLLMAAGNGTCVLEVKERAEWAKMREMQDRIRALTEQAQQEPARLAAAVRAVEDRVLATVQAALSDVWAGMQRTDAQVNITMAPFVHSLAMSQMDLKAQLEMVDARAMKAEQAIAPFLQTLAMEQIDTRCRLDQLAKLEHIDVDSLHAQISKVSEDVQGLREHDTCAQQSFKSLQTEVRHAISKMDSDLRMDLQCMRDEEKLAQHAFKALQADVRRLEEQSPREFGKIEVAGWSVPMTSAMREEASVRSDHGSRLETAIRRSPSGQFPGYAYSMKAPPLGAKDATTSPFARSCGAPHRLRTPGCRSLPHLPPVS